MTGVSPFGCRAADPRCRDLRSSPRRWRCGLSHRRTGSVRGSDDACALVLDDRGHVVLEVTAEHTAEQLNVRALRHEHVDIAEQRVGLDVDLGRGAAGSREVDRHIAQDRDRDQLVLDIPCLRSLATSAALEHRVDREQPSTALSKSS